MLLDWHIWGWYWYESWPLGAQAAISVVALCLLWMLAWHWANRFDARFSIYLYWSIGLALTFLCWFFRPWFPWTSLAWFAVALGVTAPFWTIIIDAKAKAG